MLITHTCDLPVNSQERTGDTDLHYAQLLYFYFPLSIRHSLLDSALFQSRHEVVRLSATNLVDERDGVIEIRFLRRNRDLIVNLARYCLATMAYLSQLFSNVKGKFTEL